jgi:hypothetical protein
MLHVEHGVTEERGDAHHNSYLLGATATTLS